MDDENSASGTQHVISNRVQEEEEENVNGEDESHGHKVDYDVDGDEIFDFQPENKLTFWNIFVMQSVLDTSSAIISLPSAFGQLGYVLGPMILVGWCCIAYLTSSFLLDVIIRSERKIMNLGDVGFEIAGERGRYLLRGTQILNLFLTMPSLIALQAESWQYVARLPWGCIGWWAVIMFFVNTLVINFLRHYKQVSIVALIIIVATLPNTIIFLIQYKDRVIDSSLYMGPSQSFGSPEDGRKWYRFSTAIGLICFSYTPVEILAETMARAKDPTCYKRALAWSTLFQVVLYLGVGILCTKLWGWLIEIPITLEIPYSWIGIMRNVFCALASLADFVIVSLIVVEFTRDVFRRSRFETLQKLSHYRIVTVLPSTVMAFLLVTLVKNFGSLVGILSGLTIISANTYLITIAWLVGGRAIELGRVYTYFFYLCLAVGVPLTIFIVTGSIKNSMQLGWTYGDIFCRRST